jgi:hypothetical protein
MITREEAYNIDVLTPTGINTRMLIDKIYDSIGCCKKCKFVDLSKHKWKDPTGKIRKYEEYRCELMDLNSDCSRVEPTDFCQSFEKKK